MKKKPYVKPIIVFESYETGELFGSPEMIAHIQEENEMCRAEIMQKCSYEDMPCIMRQGGLRRQNL